MGEHSVTGIPVDLMFLALGSLVTLIYLDMRRTMRQLAKESVQRGRSMIRMSTYLELVCQKLGIRYTHTDGEDP